ncbi:MAG: hypothetical protein KKC76_07385 [Proteobacteria bacterium]|nr:hypothetical protein [Pseudomonadota bacterium]MBU4296881.1 hypothetical protein [Pseudomonadota bacterium]MCG2746519.1 hypothetical protein [Desulfobulbaceae bacterium]
MSLPRQQKNDCLSPFTREDPALQIKASLLSRCRVRTFTSSGRRRMLQIFQWALYGEAIREDRLTTR